MTMYVHAWPTTRGRVGWWGPRAGGGAGLVGAQGWWGPRAGELTDVEAAVRIGVKLLKDLGYGYGYGYGYG